MHGLQYLWPQMITCLGSFSNNVHFEHVSAAKSGGFKVPCLLYTLAPPTLYPCRAVSPPLPTAGNPEDMRILPLSVFEREKNGLQMRLRCRSTEQIKRPLLAFTSTGLWLWFQWCFGCYVATTFSQRRYVRVDFHL